MSVEKDFGSARLHRDPGEFGFKEHSARFRKPNGDVFGSDGSNDFVDEPADILLLKPV